LKIVKGRPYLVVPKLIPQPTWGGEYILKLKSWDKFQSLLGEKFGQSYELYSDTKLAEDIFDTANPAFGPENYNISFTTKNISDFYTNGKKPLLIKLNQALGNSFQLHIKPETRDPFWKTKPESWYFLEPGFITLGIKPDVNLKDYKKTCQKIADFMDLLSQDINDGRLNVETAREDAKKYISENDPHQFIQFVKTDKFSAVDLSHGAIHHSWEEDTSRYPLGNIVFEVQLDAMDDVATIRAFDQGKIKDDGSVRKMNIADYFKHLDSDPEHNKIENLMAKKEANPIIKSKFYEMAVLELDIKQENQNNKNHLHFYVREGKLKITAGETTVTVGCGHSCFIPPDVDKYILDPIEKNTVILKTYQPKL